MTPAAAAVAGRRTNERMAEERVNEASDVRGAARLSIRVLKNKRVSCSFPRQRHLRGPQKEGKIGHNRAK